MDCKDPNCRCGFSYNDTGRWLEVGDPGLGFAAVEHEPGWDFFDLQGPSHLDVLHVRRSFPIRLVRLYRHWPSSEVLQTALHPGGVQQLQLKVPEKAKRLARWIIAVCPSTLAFRGTKRVPPSMPLSAAAAAVAAAVSEVEANDLERRAKGAASGSLSGYLRQSTSPCSSTASGAPTSTAASTPRLGAVAILTQLYEEQVLTALRAGENSGDDALDEAIGIRARMQEIAALKEDLALERAAKDVAQASARQASLELAELREQCSELQRLLRTAERDKIASEMQLRQLSADLQHAKTFAWSDDGERKPRNLEEVVSSVVALEIKELQGASSPEERAVAKRKLLLRWHPDKNSGNGAANDLAKRIMQELQIHADWGSPG
ncbi:unnamed protein product [Durusdinium trenchii]|uniref:J domain-containing protein n=1 Tax=Durusdinium trenchii TaxID=1381693 RepID=A0ABP0SES3_9DINO